MQVFSESDRDYLASKGIDPEAALRQIEMFKSGFRPVELIRPATIGDGLMAFSEKQCQHYIEMFEASRCDYKVMKFVPASGAATRMFKDLFKAIEQLEAGHESIPSSVQIFFNDLEKFAFYEILMQELNKQGLKEVDWKLVENQLLALKTLLNKDGLGYGYLPKALLLFHRCEKDVFTAMEEQVAEGFEYALGDDDVLHVHFTISPEHHEAFQQRLEFLNEKYTDRIDITFSTQAPETDQLAVNTDFSPARDASGKLVLRPGGHGALLRNLEALDADIVFLKNIDNVVPASFREDTVYYKKVLGGLLISIIEELSGYLTMLDDGNIDENDLDEMMQYASKTLCISIPDYLKDAESLEKIDFLWNVFNRPVRVCGMVKNEGEPGGGPFFVVDEVGEASLQIVESAQINANDVNQKSVFQTATHFNPVDIVCSIRSFENEPFSLEDFVDLSTGFITRKSLDGRDILAMELPGLWNGAMADWNTIFVEVPISTFNPVKEVNDLLRPLHQNC